MRHLVVIAAAILMLGVSTAGQMPEEKPDWIQVLAVSTDRPLKAGVEIEFTFDVEYDLISAEKGSINVGFNLDSPMAFRLVGRQLVDAGPGVISIKVKAVPVDWQDRAVFTALLILSEYPHDVAWMPLADLLYPIELAE